MRNRFLEVTELDQVPLRAKETGQELLRKSSGIHEIKGRKGEQGCYLEGRMLCGGRVLRVAMEEAERCKSPASQPISLV